MDPDRMMQNMMRSMGFFDDPFGARGQFGDGPADPMAMITRNFMTPFPPMMMNPYHPGMQHAMSLSNNGTNNGGFSFCSSSVTSYTTDEHGRPQVFQQSQEVKQGPNGVKETKSSLRDSRTGQQELAIGHHLHDKSHVKKKSKNAISGEEEQTEDFVNIDESEADRFEETWMNQARNITPYAYNQIQYGGRPRNNRLAIASSSNRANDPTTSQDDSAVKVKKEKKKKNKIFKI